MGWQQFRSCQSGPCNVYSNLFYLVHFQVVKFLKCLFGNAFKEELFTENYWNNTENNTRCTKLHYKTENIKWFDILHKRYGQNTRHCHFKYYLKSTKINNIITKK